MLDSPLIHQHLTGTGHVTSQKKIASPTLVTGLTDQAYNYQTPVVTVVFINLGDRTGQSTGPAEVKKRSKMGKLASKANQLASEN